ADLLQIAKRPRLGRDRSAVHARPDAVGPAGLARDAVVHLPHLDPPRVAPHDPLAIYGIVPRGRTRQCLCRLRAERAVAVCTEADALAAEACPAVVGEYVGMRALDDLAQHAREVLSVVGAVDACDVLVARPVRVAL